MGHCPEHLPPGLPYLFLFAGANSLTPVGKVTCHHDHTVDITITHVDDIAEWRTADWRLQNSASCEPTSDNRTVNYDGLTLPDCAWSSEQLQDGIKYILKISVKTSNPGGTGQLYANHHLYYVSCEYGNQNKTVASFVPYNSRQGNNDSSM